MTFVCLEQNRNEVEDFKRKWHGRVDEIIISFAKDWAGKMNVDGFKSKLDTSSNICKSLWKDMIILSNGRVALCCNDYEGDEEMGDINFHKILDVWNGTSFRKYRTLHREGRRSEIGLCENCSEFSFWWRI